MIEEIGIFFVATFFVWALMSLLLLANIANDLRDIRNDLREYFKAESRRWASDYEWRNSD